VEKIDSIIYLVVRPCVVHERSSEVLGSWPFEMRSMGLWVKLGIVSLRGNYWTGVIE
jgi:hypothetical protein